jgi:hypothetical protein
LGIALRPLKAPAIALEQRESMNSKLIVSSGKAKLEF